jgi:hypothetical protein
MLIVATLETTGKTSKGKKMKSPTHRPTRDELDTVCSLFIFFNENIFIKPLLKKL